MNRLFGALALLGVLGCTAGDDKDPVQGEQCVSCHIGIEKVHESIPANNCVLCHGGDGDATEQDQAHVPVPSDWAEVRGDALPPAASGFIRDFSPDQLSALDPAYLQFINPGDIRVVNNSCGPCHPSQAATVRNSIMTTNAGHYMPTRFLAGQQDRNALYGSHPASDPDCDPEANPGTVCSLDVLPLPDDDQIDAALASGSIEDLEDAAYPHYLKKRCDTCHAAGFGKNNAKHLYRSTGCTSCHMVYDTQGVYQGADEALPRNAFPYSAKHEITTAIPSSQCATCHFQGGRIGLLFRGIREAGFPDPDSLPPHAEIWDPGAYGRGDPNFYVSDEDTTNNYDETPPDLHYSAGMHCADCHVGSDVHGDGRIYSTAKGQYDLKCEDCHGTVRQRREPDVAGQFRTDGRGRVLPQLSTGSSGEVLLTTVMGDTLTVPQPADILASPQATAAMRTAMAPDAHDWSHTDSLTCDTCHTSYNLQCLGCHVEVDFSGKQIDHQLGTLTTGLVGGNRERYDLDLVLIGQGPDGRAQTVNSSQQVQLTVRDRDREIVLGVQPTNTAGEPEGRTLGEFRAAEQADYNIGFAPFFQHTSSAKPRTCDQCHRTDDSPEELARVRGVYGFGTGQYMLEAPDGHMVDALQFIDDAQNPLTTWVHPNTGPLPTPRLDRAVGVILDQLEAKP